jgi:hypothetical protein
MGHDWLCERASELARAVLACVYRSTPSTHYLFTGWPTKLNDTQVQAARVLVVLQWHFLRIPGRVAGQPAAYDPPHMLQKLASVGCLM